MNGGAKRSLDEYTDLGPERLRRLKAWREGIPQSPVFAELYPTMACNLNCLFCRRQTYFPPVPRGPELSEERLLRLIDEITELDILEVCIKGGGEPLLRRAIVERAAERFGKALVRGQLITNGTLLDERLAGLLVDSGWMEVCFSLDSPSSDTHDYLRDRKGAHALASKNLRALAAAKRRANRKFPVIKVNMVVTARNCAQIGDMLDFCRDNEVNSLDVDAMDPGIPGSEHLQLSQEQAREFNAQVPHWAEKAAGRGIYTNLRLFENAAYIQRAKAGPEQKPAPCLLPWQQVSIRADGSLVPCCLASDDHTAPALHGKSLAEAWFGATMESLRNTMLSGTKPWFCGGCTQAFADNNLRQLNESGFSKRKD